MRSTNLRFLLLLALLSTPAPLAFASPNAASCGDAIEGERRCILELDSGQKIRVLARQTNGAWEYQSKGQWKALRAGQVTGVELEKDALAAFEAARSKANLKVPEHRLELARLALDRGLVQEGLDQLEFVLRGEPDRKEALELLARRWLLTVPSLDVATEALPKAKEELLRFGAGAPVTVRELAVNELKKLPADDALRADLEKELRSQIITRREFAALALRRLMPGESVKPLLLHAVLDPSEDVRRGASLALKAVADPAVTLPVIKAMSSPNATVRQRATEALGNMGYAAALEPVMARMAAVAAGAGGGDRLPHSHIFVGTQRAYIQDFDVEVAQFQAVADPQINTLIEGMSTEAAVSGELVVTSVTESVVLRRAARQLAGVDVGDTNKAWLEWWEKNKAKWLGGEAGKPATGD
ncbi:MAG: HEAT repeat domain-containing protein [Planctomycetes bacterium]|nr:HEAT repeat domain-containing protein [Planctomycetota bacterium]